MGPGALPSGDAPAAPPSSPESSAPGPLARSASRPEARPRPRPADPAPAAVDEVWVPLSTTVRRSIRKRLKVLAVDEERPMQLLCDEALAAYLDAHGR